MPSLLRLGKQDLQGGEMEDAIGLQLLLAYGRLAEFIFQPLRQSTKPAPDLP